MFNLLFNVFRCSTTLFKVVCFPFFTVLAVNHYRFGIKRFVVLISSFTVLGEKRARETDYGRRNPIIGYRGVRSECQVRQFFTLQADFSTSYISCPLDPKGTLGIKLPYFVMVVKNMKRYFTFEVQVFIL